MDKCGLQVGECVFTQYGMHGNTMWGNLIVCSLGYLEKAK